MTRESRSPPSIVEQTFGDWLGFGAVKQKTAPPAVNGAAIREALL
jgi:hypothetical protein